MRHHSGAIFLRAPADRMSFQQRIVPTLQLVTAPANNLGSVKVGGKGCHATLTRPAPMSGGRRVKGLVRAHKRSAEPRPLDAPRGRQPH
jgi:hypothetical protein